MRPRPTAADTNRAMPSPNGFEPLYRTIERVASLEGQFAGRDAGVCAQHEETDHRCPRARGARAGMCRDRVRAACGRPGRQPPGGAGGPGGLGVTLPSSVVETPDGSRSGSPTSCTACAASPPPASSKARSARPSRSAGRRNAAGGRRGPDAADRCPPDRLRRGDRELTTAEGSSAGSGVWRMHWDAATGAIDAATKIYDSTAADDRVFGLTLTETGDVVFSSKRTDNIRRIASPGGDHVPARRGPRHDDRLQPQRGGDVARRARLDRLPGRRGRPDPHRRQHRRRRRRRRPRPPRRSWRSPPTRSTSASTPARATRVSSTRCCPTPRPTASARRPTPDGFTNVTGLGVRADGGVYVAQDATGSLTPSVEGLGMADLFVRPYGAADLPVVRFTVRPRVAATKQGPWAFAFAAAANATGTTRFECRLDDGRALRLHRAEHLGRRATRPSTSSTRAGAAWRSATTTTRPTPPRPVGPDRRVGLCRSSRRPGRDDAQRLGDTKAVGGAFRLRFRRTVTDPSQLHLRASTASTPCPAARRRTTRVSRWATTRSRSSARTPRATRAPATWSVTAVPTPPKPKPVTGPNNGDPPATPLSPPTPGPVTVPVTPVAPRLGIGVPCVEVSPSPRCRPLRCGAARRSSLPRPGQARYDEVPRCAAASGGRRAARVVETLGYARVARAAAHTTRIALTRGQRSRVRAGRLRLAVAYGTCRTQVGDWRYLTNATTREGTNR